MEPWVGIDPCEEACYAVQTRSAGPPGELPLDPDFLREAPSGEIFGLSQNVGMGWRAAEVRRPPFLILSTLGGVRSSEGKPIALGYHIGHWEVGELVQEAAHTITRLGGLPFAVFVSDPCDGRTQGTTGMMDSLPYRNDAAMVLRRLARSLPNRRGVMGIATCDKGLPAMLMALAAMRDVPAIFVPGGVALPPEEGEDAGTVQTLGVRFAHGLVSLAEARVLACRACATPGGGCQFLGTAATGQIVAEALGLSLLHAALTPSGQPIWRDMARRSAEALMHMARNGIRVQDILTEAALENAMAVFAAFGGSTNFLLHLPAIAHAAGLPRPTVADWMRISQRVPRLVDALPNGPEGHPTVRVFLAGGVPEVMLHLRTLGLLHLDTLTAHGRPLGEMLDRWQRSERRRRLRERLQQLEGITPDRVICSPEQAEQRGFTGTITFITGNLAPEGAIVKSTAIDPSLLDARGVYYKLGPARVFTSEKAAIAAIKGQGTSPVRPGDVILLIGRGPLGAGMAETYQITAALRHLPWGKEIALITDGRFSGVSTGPCIGHVSPEALADGPIARVRDGDLIEITIDTRRLQGRIDIVGPSGQYVGAEHATRLLSQRPPHPELQPDPSLPEDTRLWAVLQHLSGGPWGGCVYDVDALLSWIASLPKSTNA